MENKKDLILNEVTLKVVLNHFEQKDFNNRNYNVYTLTDFDSGVSFDIWSVEKLDYIESLKLLIDPIFIKFKLTVKKSGGFKLIPLEYFK